MTEICGTVQSTVWNSTHSLQNLTMVVVLHYVTKVPNGTDSHPNILQFKICRTIKFIPFGLSIQCKYKKKHAGCKMTEW